MGLWHEKNFQVNMQKCFDVEYKTNEVGARDDPFIKLDEENNIILLEVREGYGIEKEKYV